MPNPKIPGKEGKSAQKSKEIPCNTKKARKNPKKQGKEDQGDHSNREIRPTNSLTKVRTEMHTGVYTKMSTEMPTRVGQQDTKEYLNQRGSKTRVFRESKKGG